MRKSIVGGLLSGAIAFAIVATPARVFADELRVEDAVKLALENNERAKKTPLRVDQAEGQLARARTAFFPVISASASEQIRGYEDKTGRNWSNSGTVQLTQPIVAPSAFPLYSQASHQLESEKWGAAQDRRQLAFDTAKAFLQTIAAERVAEAAKSRLDRAQANLENAQARAAAGLASTNDATRAELDLANAQASFATATGTAQRTRIGLEFLCATPITQALALPDRTTTAAQKEHPAPNEVLDAALDRRPDVRAAHEKTEALRASAREPYWRLIPTLNANAQLKAIPDPLPTDRALDENITFNLQWQIFDAGVRYADRRTRVAQADSQALDESLLRRSVSIDVRSAVTTLRAAREAYRITENAVNAAQKSAEETEILYKQGLARAIELTTANGSRFDAEVSRAQAKLNMEQAYLELRFALGYGPVDE